MPDCGYIFSFFSLLLLLLLYFALGKFSLMHLINYYTTMLKIYIITLCYNVCLLAVIGAATIFCGIFSVKKS